MSKGSRPRPILDRKAYDENYDAIFRKKGAGNTCSTCGLLREKRKFDWVVKFCRHKGQHNPCITSGCELWEPRGPNYSPVSTISDYS